MINRNAPQIEVGILKSGKIRFSLDGNFRVGLNDSILEGDAEAEIADGAISILCKKKRISFGEPLILEPLIIRKDSEGEEICAHFLTPSGYYLRYGFVEFNQLWSVAGV